MENNTDPIRNLAYGREAALLKSAGVAGNTNLAAGIILGYSLVGLITYFRAFWFQTRGLNSIKRTLVMSFTCQQSRLRGVQNIHGPLICLFLVDLVNAIAALIFGIELAGSVCSLLCFNAFITWYLSRWFGVILHLLNILVTLIYLDQPQLGAKLRNVFSLFLLLVVVILLVFIFASPVETYLMASVIFALAVVIIGALTQSPRSLSAAVHRKAIVFVATLTFFVVFFATFVFQCLVATSRYDYTDIYVNVLFFTSCHLIINGYLCSYMLRFAEEDEQQQQQQGVENPAFYISHNVQHLNYTSAP